MSSGWLSARTDASGPPAARSKRRRRLSHISSKESSSPLPPRRNARDGLGAPSLPDHQRPSPPHGARIAHAALPEQVTLTSKQGVRRVGADASPVGARVRCEARYFAFLGEAVTDSSDEAEAQTTPPRKGSSPPSEGGLGAQRPGDGGDRPPSPPRFSLNPAVSYAKYQAWSRKQSRRVLRDGSKRRQRAEEGEEGPGTAALSPQRTAGRDGRQKPSQHVKDVEDVEDVESASGGSGKEEEVGHAPLFGGKRRPGPGDGAAAVPTGRRRRHGKPKKAADATLSRRALRHRISGLRKRAHKEGEAPPAAEWRDTTAPLPGLDNGGEALEAEYVSGGEQASTRPKAGATAGSSSPPSPSSSSFSSLEVEGDGEGEGECEGGGDGGGSTVQQPWEAAYEAAAQRTMDDMLGPLIAARSHFERIHHGSEE